ncbi:MAG: TRAP transporter substrate-binding protein DctP, partial [Betaproteobacteria bacterium]
ANSAGMKISSGPSAGLINDWLREESPGFKSWGIGGQVRAQYDAKRNAGSFPDAVPDGDFIRNGVDNDDTLFLLRSKLHVGYKLEWFNVFAEVRDSRSSGDDRNPNPFDDQFDLHQAFLKLGNPKMFPFSLKVGRQQISYGEVYLALQSGVVDGQENPLANIHAAKFYEVQKYLTFTNHKYEATALIMSTASFDRLSDADKKIVREAALEAGAYQRKLMADSDEKLIAEFRKMPSLQMNAVDTAPFKKATEVVWDEWEKKPFGEFVKKLRAART